MAALKEAERARKAYEQARNAEEKRLSQNCLALRGVEGGSVRWPGGGLVGGVVIAGCVGSGRVVGLVRAGAIDRRAGRRLAVRCLSGAAAQAMLVRCWWSLSMFPARLMSFHSLRTAGRPRRRKRRVLRLCLRSPKIGSIRQERCL